MPSRPPNRNRNRERLWLRGIRTVRGHLSKFVRGTAVTNPSSASRLTAIPSVKGNANLFDAEFPTVFMLITVQLSPLPHPTAGVLALRIVMIHEHFLSCAWARAVGSRTILALSSEDPPADLADVRAVLHVLRGLDVLGQQLRPANPNSTLWVVPVKGNGGCPCRTPRWRTARHSHSPFNQIPSDPKSSWSE